MADPSQPIGRIELLDPEERHQLLVEWNATARELPQATLVSLFEAQVERSPEAIALVFEESTLSYAELNLQANRLAHYLIGRGIGRRTWWPSPCPARPEMIIALLGILKAGASLFAPGSGLPGGAPGLYAPGRQPACVLTNARNR